MLIITNGDSALEAIRALGIEARYLAWRDVLHDGPVPEGLGLPDLSSLRAAYLARRGWGELSSIHADFVERDLALSRFREHGEVLLWFEQDLYDQLQLMQILEWFSGREMGSTRLTWICESGSIAAAPAETLAARFEARQEVPPHRLEEAWRTWQAVRAATPRPLTSLVEAGISSPLRTALVRLLEEYPAPDSGLSRSERQILAILNEEPLRADELFRRAARLEKARYLGDWSFWGYLEDLAGSDEALLRGADEPFAAFNRSKPARFHKRRLEITELGRDVLEGRRDRVRELGINKWIGGVHLRKSNVWRWDAAKRQLSRD